MKPKQSNEKNPEKMLSIKTKLLGTILPLTIIIGAGADRNILF